MAHTQTVALLIVDHYRVVREGVRAMVHHRGGIEVVAEAGSVGEGMAQALVSRPTIALVGTEFPDGRAVDLIRNLRRSVPSTRTVVFSPVADDELFFEAVAAGAAGFIVEDIETDRLVAALRLVGGGGTLVTPEAIDELREKMHLRLPDALLAELTGQEARILAMVVEGATNAEIARRLRLAEKTVRNYMSNILAKAGARNRTELTAAVVRSATRNATGVGRRRVITVPEARVPVG